MCKTSWNWPQAVAQWSVWSGVGGQTKGSTARSGPSPGWPHPGAHPDPCGLLHPVWGAWGGDRCTGQLTWPSGRLYTGYGPYRSAQCSILSRLISYSLLSTAAIQHTHCCTKDIAVAWPTARRYRQRWLCRVYHCGFLVSAIG